MKGESFKSQWGSSSRCGSALSSDGSRIVISLAKDSESFEVFDYADGSWQRVGQKFSISTRENGTGVDISANGNRIVYGSDGRSVNDQKGRVAIFSLVNDEWVKIAPDIEGDQSNELWGWAPVISHNGQRVASWSQSYVNSDGFPDKRVRLFRLP